MIRYLPLLLADTSRLPALRARAPGAARAGEAGGKNAEARRPLADTSLVDIVKQALMSQSSLDAGKIDLENRNGNVSITGTVESAEQREKVERIVMSVGGVRSVTNNLAIADS